MVDFNPDEQFYKWVVKLNFSDSSFFTIWGTDKSDNDEDKFLVKAGKIILFSNLRSLESQLFNYKLWFFDKENFDEWLERKQDFNKYAEIDIQILRSFSMDILLNKDQSFILLDALNILQDFFIQVKDVNAEEIYSLKEIRDLKDYIYNNFFWSRDDSNDNIISLSDLNEGRIKVHLIELYRMFRDRCFLAGMDEF
jgi:hypothetical protein